MQLILMRGPFSRTSVLSIKKSHIVLLFVALGLAAVFFTSAGLYLAARFGEEIPVIQDIVYSRQLAKHHVASETGSPLDAMAIRLAEMRAQLARLLPPAPDVPHAVWAHLRASKSPLRNTGQLRVVAGLGLRSSTFTVESQLTLITRSTVTSCG